MTKQMGSPEDEEKQIDLISFILVVLVVAVLPLILIPKVVNTPINTRYFLDVFGYYKLVILIILSMFMITLMGFKAIRRKQHIKISIPLVLFVLWILVSLFFAKDIAVAFHGYPMRWQGFLAYFCYAALFVFIVNMVRPKYYGKILVALFICVCISAIHSLLNYYGIEPSNLFLEPFYNARISPDVSRGTLGNRNTAGAFFAITTIIPLVLFLKNKSNKKNIFYFITFVLSYTGLLVSLTRVAWLGTIGALILTAIFLRKDLKKNIKKSIIIFVSFVVILSVLDITGNGKIIGRYYSMKQQIKQANEGNIEQLGTYRFYIYGRALKVIADNPIVGTGPDCFAYYATLTKEDYEKDPGLRNVGYFDKVHSEYLEYAATMGIPALIFYMWFILSILIPWYRKRKQMKPEILAIFLGLTAYLMQACFNFGSISTLPIFFVLLGILKNALVNESDEENNHIEVLSN
jgi:O-antigen ligase